jgi:hypothetical protein
VEAAAAGQPEQVAFQALRALRVQPALLVSARLPERLEAQVAVAARVRIPRYPYFGWRLHERDRLSSIDTAVCR